eukprot:178408_1
MSIAIALSIILVQLLWHIHSQWVDIWFDDGSDNKRNTEWTPSSPNLEYIYFNYIAEYNDDDGCYDQGCIVLWEEEGNPQSVYRGTNITLYSKLRLKYHVSTYKLEAKDSCIIRYAYDDITATQLVKSISSARPYGAMHRYTQNVTFPSAVSKHMLWISLETFDDRGGDTDICYWDNIHLQGVFATPNPTFHPTILRTLEPTAYPTSQPSVTPSQSTSAHPSQSTSQPTSQPIVHPTSKPTLNPTKHPTFNPIQSTVDPSTIPTVQPTQISTLNPISDRDGKYQISHLVLALISLMGVIVGFLLSICVFYAIIYTCRYVANDETKHNAEQSQDHAKAEDVQSNQTMVQTEVQQDATVVNNNVISSDTIDEDEMMDNEEGSIDSLYVNEHGNQHTCKGDEATTTPEINVQLVLQGSCKMTKMSPSDDHGIITVGAGSEGCQTNCLLIIDS